MAKILTGVEHDQMLRFRDSLRAALSMAAKERGQYQYQESSPYGSELLWTIRERDLMLELVNQRRVQLGLPEANGEEVYAIDQSAAGHVDYADKFTLRLAFLAYGLEWKP